MPALPVGAAGRQRIGGAELRPLPDWLIELVLELDVHTGKQEPAKRVIGLWERVPVAERTTRRTDIGADRRVLVEHIVHADTKANILEDRRAQEEI